MEELPLGRIAALVPEFAVKDLPLGRTLMMVIYNKRRDGMEIKIKIIAGAIVHATSISYPSSDYSLMLDIQLMNIGLFVEILSITTCINL